MDNTPSVPYAFSFVNDALLLKAAGYEHAFYPEEWEDVGGPESGPKIVGNPDTDVWTLPLSEHWEHEIAVVGGMVVSDLVVPVYPDNFPF